MLDCRCLDSVFDLHQCGMGLCEADLLLAHRRADVAGDVQVEVVLLDLVHLHSAGVAGFFLSELVGVDDLGDVLGRELVLALALYEVLGGVDEEDVVGLLQVRRGEITAYPGEGGKRGCHRAWFSQRCPILVS